MAGPLGSTPGIIVGVGVGAAASAALNPAIEIPKQRAWAANPNRILDVGLLARLVAQGGIALDAARAEALLDGYMPDKLDALRYLAQTTPAVAEALTLWRRGLISDALWQHVLVKAGLDQRYADGLTGLKTSEPIDPAVIATAVQRTVLPNPGILPNQPSTAGSNVPPMPEVNVDPYAEAEKSGVPRDVLDTLARIVGLPASPDLAARMHFRDIITEGAFNQAILEGNTRGEWAPFLLEGFRDIPTAHDYVELHLRNYIGVAEMNAGAARHGMSPEDVDVLFKAAGRPLSFHQVFIGLRRGGTLGGPVTGIDPAFLDSLHKANIRPEYYNLAWAQRFTYPSAFVLRGLAEAGNLTQAETETILLYEGWEPTLAHTVSTRWTSGGTGTGGAQTKAELLDEYAGGYIGEPELRASLGTLGYTGAALDLEVHLADARRVKRWREKAVDAIGKAFVQHDIDEATARLDLADAGVVGTAADLLIPLWQLEQRVAQKNLTAAQVKRAYKKSIITLADALARLETLNYSAADAQTYLAS